MPRKKKDEICEKDCLHNYLDELDYSIDNPIDRDEVVNHIKDWVKIRISPDFTFREHQLETITDVVCNILNHHYQNYIIEAPTGSGKSLINIISAGVLADYYSVTSYILCSDLFLWEQYEKFLNKHKHTGIASLKGQTGNYTCLRNGEDMKNADCKMAGMSWASLFHPASIKRSGFDCAYKCKYVKARKKAIKAKVCIMTYQLFLFIFNNPQYNQDSHGQPIFTPHDVLFCDECHNIPEIVQLQYSPTIVPEHFDKLESLYKGSTERIVDLFDEETNKEWMEHNIHKAFPKFSMLKDRLNKFWEVWTCPESRKDEDCACANEYLDILLKFNDSCQDIKTAIINKRQTNEKLSKDDIQMFKLVSWYENYMCHWNDFVNAINICGNEYLLKDINIANDDKHISVAFKCTKEDFITWYFLLDRAKYKVMVSATIGTKEAYDERMGFHYEERKEWTHKNAIVDESYMTVIPSTFSFTESPIYFFNKFKMSYREREISFHHLKNAIYSICSTKFDGQKGLIQTGSYEFAKRLYDDAPPEVKKRMLVYNGSREKVMMVGIHKMSKDTILVGPTLNTGIDLPGDECRFIVILKVPYPSLADKLVNERNKLYPLWYNTHTSNEIIQGIGRGVRYNGDWCVTYILDACFNALYKSTKEQYSDELRQRIKYI